MRSIKKPLSSSPSGTAFQWGKRDGHAIQAKLKTNKPGDHEVEADQATERVDNNKSAGEEAPIRAKQVQSKTQDVSVQAKEEEKVEAKEDEDKLFNLDFLKREEIDPAIQEHLRKEFGVYTEHQLKLIDSGDSAYMAGNKKLETKEAKRNRFLSQAARFQNRMQGRKRSFWGTRYYARLMDKWFPDYNDVVENKVGEVKNTINGTISETNKNIALLIENIEKFIVEADKNTGTALRLIDDANVNLAEAVAQKEETRVILEEYAGDKVEYYMAAYDLVVAKYNVLITGLLLNAENIGKDKTRLNGLIGKLHVQQDILGKFESKVNNTNDVLALLKLQDSEYVALLAVTEQMISEMKQVKRETSGPDEAAVRAELKSGEETVNRYKSEREILKQAEIKRREEEEERRRKEEEERKKAAEEQKNGGSKVTSSNSAMLNLSPEEFFIVYEQRAQKYLDQYYNRDEAVWKAFKKNQSNLFLTGKELADAAKYVYEHAKTKDLKLIAPVELAIGQAKVEGGVKPLNENERTVINPMNAGVPDGGKDNKKAASLFGIRDKLGWKEARKEGLRYYYKVMYDLWMPDYDTVEKMMEYDHFDNNGNTNYTGRYATAVYYEAKVKAEAGIMRMTEDGKLLTKTVGGGKETTEDKKAVYTYIQAFDKAPGKLKNISYSAFVKLENGIPTSSSLNAAIRAIQENEIFPAPSTFGKHKKEIYDGMGTLDKKGSLEGRAKGVDGEAGKFGPTIGFLYYHYLLAGGSVFNSETNATSVEKDAQDQDHTATTNTPNEKKEGNNVKTTVGEDLDIDKNTEKHYTVTNGEARVRNEKGQELNAEGGIFKAGDKYKIIPKGTKVIVTEEKDARVKVKSTDSKTDYGWTSKSNLTRIAGVSEIKTWKDKKVTATTIADKNKEYAELILEAEELGITQFSEQKVRQTFVKIKNLEKIGNGKKKGNSENWYSDPKTTEIIIMETIISILKSEIDIWLAGDQKDKISNVKIGSFMIWSDYTNDDGIKLNDELRTSNHGGRGRAIDLNIDGTDFTSNAALEMVNRIISNLPEIDGRYEIGLPYQGQFFPLDQKWTKTNKKPLKLQKPVAQSGSKIVLDYIKSEKLKKTFKDLQKKGYKFEIFPDNDNHLHLAVE